MVVIEMNPRVSRSSALASKATGFPIAKIAAKLALGYHLDEIPNDITRLTPASFEPTIDYVVVKIPRWNFEKFPQADRTLTTQMKSVGEVMAIGRTFKEAFMKGVRSLELGRSGFLFAPADADRAEPDADDDIALRKQLAVPTDRRLWDLFRAIDRGWSVEQIHSLTKIDPWFLRQFAEIAELRRAAASDGLERMTADRMRQMKRAGFGDGELALAFGTSESGVRDRRLSQNLKPVYKRVDTCAAEFESFTPYLYSSYESDLRGEPERARQGRHPRQRPEPNRAGHRVRLLLLSRGLRPQGRRPRDDHGELQPGNGVDRLRHSRSSLFPAADVRRRHGRDRDRAIHRRGSVVCGPVRRADAVEAGAGAATSWRPDTWHVS